MMSKLTSGIRARRVRGYSMIELVVAITIGVFLLMGLFTVFQSTRQGTTEASGLAELEDEERLAMTILTDMIQNAGYFPDPMNNTVTTTFGTDSSSFATYPGGGQLFYGTAGTSDTMMVRFEAAPGDPIINCNGGQNPSSATSNVVYVNYFKLTTNKQGISQLGCAVGPDSATVTSSATPVMGLVNNVVGLKFSYALNTTGTLPSTSATSAAASGGSTVNNRCPADTYKPSSGMVLNTSTTINDWTNVCAVKVTLTFTNPLYQPPGQPNPTPGQATTIAFERVIAVRSMSGIDITTTNSAPTGSGTGSGS